MSASDRSAAGVLARLRGEPPEGIALAKWRRLERYLEALPMNAAGKLFAALEHDRRNAAAHDEDDSAGGLPHDALTAVLRRRYFSEGAAPPQRPAQAQRLFYTPIEAFLTPVRRGRKRAARIPRTSLTPIWRLLMKDDRTHATRDAAGALDKALARSSSKSPTPALSRATSGVATGASDHDQEKLVRELTINLMQAAATDLASLARAAHDNVATGRLLAASLGGDNGGAAALQDLQELSRLMPLAGVFEDMARRFPHPVSRLSDEDIFDIRRFYAEAHEIDPQDAVYVLLFFTGWLEAPWRAMALHYELADVEDPALPLLGDDSAAVGETLFDDLETLARALERDAADVFEPADISARFEFFAAYADGLADMGRDARDTVRVNRVEACRDVGAAACARAVEQAVAAVRAVMPQRKARGSVRLFSLRPDIDVRLTKETVMAAKAAAAFLLKAPKIAERLQRAGASPPVHKELATEIEQYANDIVMEIRAAEDARRDQAKRLMSAVLAVAAPLLSEGATGLLRDRAAAAAVSG